MNIRTDVCIQADTAACMHTHAYIRDIRPGVDTLSEDMPHICVDINGKTKEREIQTLDALETDYVRLFKKIEGVASIFLKRRIYNQYWTVA